MRSRAVCFTSRDRRQLDPSVWAGCTYAVWQLELSEANVRSGGLQHHWQGYAEFDKAMRFTTLHTYDGLEQAHFEPRKGTQAQAITYCQKEDTRIEGPWEWGVKKEQGQRTDLEEMRRDLDGGKTLAVVARAHFPVWIKYPSAVKSYQALQAKDRDQLPEVYIILGSTRTGKSRLARSMFPGAYWKPNFDYWENYQYEDAIVLDEFYGHKMQYSDLLQLLDSTPCLVNVKGASAKLGNASIVFTSNQHPRYWYKPETLARHCQNGWDDSPLKARFDEFGTYIMCSPVVQGPAVAPPVEFDPTLPVTRQPRNIDGQPASIINNNNL